MTKQLSYEQVQLSSENYPGVVKLSTNEEVDNLSNNTSISPAKLNYFYNNKLATNTDIDNLNNLKIITPEKLSYALDKRIATSLKTGLVRPGTFLEINEEGIMNVNVTSLSSSVLTGTIADARLSGIYSGFTHKIDGTNTVFTTTSPGSDALLGRTVYGLAEFESTNSAATGAIIFIAPNTTSTIMYQFEISGMLYNADLISIIVNGYRNTGSWLATKKISTGTIDVMVRFGVTPDGKNCLILGDVNTTWSYPHISIIRAMFSYSNISDSYCYGWTTTITTSLTGYTQVTSAIPDTAMIGSITGNAGTVTSRTLTIGSTGKSYNGSANVSWTLAEIGAAATSHTHSYAALPTSSSLPVGTVTRLRLTTASASIANGSTNPGSGLVIACAAATPSWVNGGAQAGTWKNISGITLTTAGTCIGLWVRTA